MKILLNLPDYDEDGIDVIWEDNSRYTIGIYDNDVILTANKSGLISLAKQMLYMAHNNLPTGSHVHYDGFFAQKGEGEYELIIEKID